MAPAATEHFEHTTRARRDSRGTSVGAHQPEIRPGVPSHRQTRISSPVAVSSRFARTFAFASTTAPTRDQSAARALTDGSSWSTRSRSWSTGRYGAAVRAGSVKYNSSWLRNVSSATWASCPTRLCSIRRAVRR
jgi:hypothetical protein